MTDRYKDQSAPMDFTYDTPRDPGLFGMLPNKRVHLETLDGQSSWAPSPQNTAHHAANAPLLFSNSSKASFGFSRYQHLSKQVQQETQTRHDENGMAVDGADYGGMKRQRHAEVADVEMESVESPIRGVEPHKGAQGSLETEDASASAGPSSPRPVEARPVSLNAVKKSAKHLREAQAKEHGTRGPSDDGREKPNRKAKGKGRGAVGDGSLVLWETDGDEHDFEYDGDDALESEASPLASRLRRRRSPRRSTLRTDDRYTHDSSQSALAGPTFHGNQYHLHIPQGADLGMASRGSDLKKGGGGGGIKHSELPYIFLGYLQFVFNAGVVLIGLYLVITFILTIRHDVKQKMGAYSSEIMQEISTCTSLYIINRCEPATRIPAMETACTEWESCMGRDPTVVGHARVGALTFADVITTFVDALSWKTIFFILAFSTCLILITNSALFNLRAKHASTHFNPGTAGSHPTLHNPPQSAHFNWPPAGQEEMKKLH